MTKPKAEGKFDLGISPVAEDESALLREIKELVSVYLKKNRLSGGQWWKEEQPILPSVFGLHKFSVRLYRELFLRSVPRRKSSKVRSDAIDAAIYALFIAALITRGELGD